MIVPSTGYFSWYTTKDFADDVFACIDDVRPALFPTEKHPKPGLVLRGHDKWIVLNRFSAQTLARAFGEDTDSWRGKMVKITVQQVLFNGRKVPGIRVYPADPDPDVKKQGVGSGGSGGPGLASQTAETPTTREKKQLVTEVELTGRKPESGDER